MKNYLTEKDKGSSTRLIFVIGSFWAMALTTFLAISGAEPTQIVIVYSSLQGGLTALKLGQKIQETKPEKEQ